MSSSVRQRSDPRVQIVLLAILVLLIIVILRNCVNTWRAIKNCRADHDLRYETKTSNRPEDFYAHAFKDQESTVIYIRHGHDESSGHSHDQRLTEEGWTEAQNLARELVEKHGPPVAIFYSPFDRTTDTAKAMYRVLRDEHGISDVKIRIEPRLGKYFTSKQRSKPSVSHATLERGMIVPPSKIAFQQGLDKHHLSVKQKYPGQVVWNVTHAIGVNYHLKRITGEGTTIQYLQHLVSSSLR